MEGVVFGHGSDEDKNDSDNANTDSSNRPCSCRSRSYAWNVRAFSGLICISSDDDAPLPLLVCNSNWVHCRLLLSDLSTLRSKVFSEKHFIETS